MRKEDQIRLLAEEMIKATFQLISIEDMVFRINQCAESEAIGTNHRVALTCMQNVANEMQKQVDFYKKELGKFWCTCDKSTGIELGSNITCTTCGKQFPHYPYPIPPNHDPLPTP